MKTITNMLILLVVVVCAILSGCGMECNMNDKQINFGIIADVQYAPKPSAGKRNYAQSIHLLDTCIEDFNTRSLDFVIQLGDIIDGSDDSSADLKIITSIYNRSIADTYHVLGNHDFAGIDRTLVMKILGMENPYYDFDIGCWKFIVLDCMDLAVSGGWDKNSENYLLGQKMLDHLVSRNADNAYAWNGGISQTQLNWLDNVLKTADKNKQKAIIFGHPPLLPAGEPHTLSNAEKVIQVFEKYDCVQLYLCGHRHSGGFSEQNDIRYVTITAMVEADEDNAYAVISLNQPKIEISGVGTVENRTFFVQP